MISFLNSRKPVSVQIPHDFSTMPGGDGVADFVIPPLNTDIRHGLVLKECPKMSYKEIPKENFSWGSHDEEDSDDVKTKKGFIHKVPNQQILKI